MVNNGFQKRTMYILSSCHETLSKVNMAKGNISPPTTQAGLDKISNES